MINQLTGKIDGCEAYIDDVVIYSDNWKDHLTRMHATKFAKAKLTVNLVKSELGHAKVRPCSW